VVTAAEGSALKSARVALVEANEHRHPQVYATVTDGDGHFEIKQVEAGRYNFFATHIGYLEQPYLAKDPEDRGVTLSLTSGQTLDNAVFRLIRSGVITGRVVDDTGEPMMGVSVSILHRPSEEEREQQGPRTKKLELTMVSGGQTDDRGEYRIFVLKPGVYYVKAAETGEPAFGNLMITNQSEWRVIEEVGNQFAPVYYPGVLELDQAQVITLGPGEETPADFSMRKIKTVEVAGHVVAPDGGAANRVYVQLSHAGIEDWGGELSTSVDASGTFSIKGVAPGSYFLSAGMRDKDKFYTTRQKIEVGEAKIDSLVLMPGSGATIRSRLRTASGTALPSTRNMVHLSSITDESGSGYTSTDVNKDGTFELGGVTDGSYALMTNQVEEGWFVRSAHLGNEDALENGIQVEGGAVKGSLEIVVSNEGAQIEGTVTDSDKGEPIAGVTVKAQVDPATDYNYSRSRSATTDQNGHYVIKEVPPHKYNVTAKVPKPAAGLPTVKSEAVAVTLNDRDHRVIDFKLKTQQAE
jgi:protocatechuate 3,4-dioxygenase beta subunit